MSLETEYHFATRQWVNSELSLLSMFLLGMLGSTHCAGMCGGLACALGMSTPDGRGTDHLVKLRLMLAFNGGRISSYMLAGKLVGLVGAGLLAALPTHLAHRAGVGLSGLFLIALGLYLLSGTGPMQLMERAGRRLWRHIEPLGRRFLPVRRSSQAFVAGMVWGWLPCGLVYSALVFAAISDSFWHGALRMLAFGLGTLPMLVGIGMAGQWFSTATRHPTIRQAAGAVGVIAGVVVVVQAGHGAFGGGMAGMMIE